ncbi:Uncharacterised protein [Vibrio cholerae]|nr:Uncharacterised protein [Vibrio cholerae]
MSQESLSGEASELSCHGCADQVFGKSGGGHCACFGSDYGSCRSVQTDQTTSLCAFSGRYPLRLSYCAKSGGIRCGLSTHQPGQYR